jgi:hypothetical protein
LHVTASSSRRVGSTSVVLSLWPKPINARVMLLKCGTSVAIVVPQWRDSMKAGVVSQSTVTSSSAGAIFATGVQFMETWPSCSRSGATSAIGPTDCRSSVNALTWWAFQLCALLLCAPFIRHLDDAEPVLGNRRGMYIPLVGVDMSVFCPIECEVSVAIVPPCPPLMASPLLGMRVSRRLAPHRGC